jgi:anti-sigma B factor antagonist
VPAFSLKESDADDDYLEIAVTGELDLAVADQLEQAIDAVPRSYHGVVIALAECEFIDTTGIALILRAHQRFAKSGRRLVVCCPADQVKRLLKLIGLTEAGIVYESLEGAIKGEERAAS